MNNTKKKIGFAILFQLITLFAGFVNFVTANDTWGININETWTYGVDVGGDDWLESYNVTDITATKITGVKIKTYHGEVVETLYNQDITWCFNKLADIDALRDIAEKEDTRYYGGRTVNCLIIVNNVYDEEVIDTSTGIYLEIINGTKTYELLSWSLSGPTGQFPGEFIIIIVVITSSIVAIVIVIYFVKKKKSRFPESKSDDL